MYDQNKNSILTVSLSLKELWFLISDFSPGIIFGLENPYIGLNEEEIKKDHDQIIQNLIQRNILLFNKNGYQIDEMVGSMVYSLVNSHDQIHISDKDNKKELTIYLLPNWILGLRKIDDLIEMILYKDQYALWNYITYNFNIPIVNTSPKETIHFKEKDLELSLSLIENNSIQNALNIFESQDFGNSEKLNEFIVSYNKTKFSLEISATCNINDLIKISQEKFGVILINNSLNWIRHDIAGENLEKYLIITPIDNDILKKKFFHLVPTY